MKDKVQLYGAQNQRIIFFFFYRKHCGVVFLGCNLIRQRQEAVESQVVGHCSNAGIGGREG